MKMGDFDVCNKKDPMNITIKGKTQKNPGKNTKNNNTNKQTTKQYNEKQTNKLKQISYT